jgi:SAM-dependent methyltransferase
MMDNLNIGSGERPMENAVNLDIVDYSYLGVGEFIQDDFNARLPFEDNSFEEVYMMHALEHAENIRFNLKEIHRVLKPGGKAIIRTPYFKWPTAFSPLTHKYYFTWRSLDKAEGFSVKKSFMFYHDSRFWKIITFPLQAFFNMIPNLYECSILSTLIPAPEIEYELTKVRE